MTTPANFARSEPEAASLEPLARGDDDLIERIARGLLQVGGPIPSGVEAAPPEAESAVRPADAATHALEDPGAGLPPLWNPPPAPGATGLSSAAGYYFLSSAPEPVAARPAAVPSAPTRAPVAEDVVAPGLAQRGFELTAVRADFPILGERVHGKPLVWLDNAATTHKPRAVIERIQRYYEHEYSNVHRAAHTLAARSTDAYEHARNVSARFLGAASPREIVFVRGTTEAVNLVANSWGRRFVGRGDEIVLTRLEHHSNIVPWQFLAEAVGARIRVAPIDDRGEVLQAEYARLLNSRTRIVALTHVSNALGTVVPVAEMIHMAHRFGARVLVDGAQAVSHFPVDVSALDADFYALSGHKVFGPSGIGILYGKQAVLDEMPPWQGGGNMIEHVTFERSTFAPAPARFEAGTGALAPAVGLGAAFEYLERLGMANVARHEHELMQHATEALARIGGLRPIGTAREKASVLGFVLDGHDPVEVGQALDKEGIAVRAGHHCAQPALAHFGLTSSVRPSLAMYNTHEEIETLARALHRLASR